MQERGTARAADGYLLAVTRFPAQGAARGTLLIAGAMAVPQEFYAALARFHAMHGLHVLTFDYRGMGRSRSGPMRGCDTDVSRWAEQDLGAMLPEAHYLLSEGPGYRAAFERVKAPIVGYSFEDDELITRPAIDNLHGFYRCAAVERRHVRPADVGEERIGHFGFFAERSRDTLWKESLEWMLAKA